MLGGSLNHLMTFMMSSICFPRDFFSFSFIFYSNTISIKNTCPWSIAYRTFCFAYALFFLIVYRYILVYYGVICSMA